MRRKIPLVAVLVALASPVGAQLQSRPTDPPLVTAENESWYVLREPVQFVGDLYYPAGPPIFFNGNTMARRGHYNGIPLYADTTVEPFSVVLVPISRGLMQPYHRSTRGVAALPMAPVAPTGPPVPIGAISAYTPEPAGTGGVPSTPRIVGNERSAPLTDVVGTTGTFAGTGPRPVVSTKAPENNDGVWIEFEGERWISAGAAVPFVRSDFVRVGEYAGFPVFTRRGFTEEMIYLPTRAGLMAPYRLKE